MPGVVKHVVFQLHHINNIGGTEIAIINLCKKLKDYYRITIAYTAPNSDSKMLLRMSEFADIAYVRHNTIECDTVVRCSMYVLKTQVIAKNVIRWVHGCLGDMNFDGVKEPEVSNWVTVGNEAARQLSTIQKTNPIVIFNELDSEILDKSRITVEHFQDGNHLKLVTVSRISPEKGFERMLKLSEYLGSIKMPYEWIIVGSGHDQLYEKKIKELAPNQWKFVGAQVNPFPYIANADILVQLSDYEGFGYVVLEALYLGTTVISTDYSSAYDLVNQENGYIIKKSMEGLTPEIFTPKKFTFKYQSEWEKWLKLL
jgi:glycosyltransferase involved in cell wall biosynthesis